jgi:hypothetical protein
MEAGPKEFQFRQISLYFSVSVHLKSGLIVD